MGPQQFQKVPPRCQCDPRCKENPLPKSPFCANHRSRCPRRSPLSGSEPKYQPSLWNKNPRLRKTHNCFAYAMNIQDPRQIKACREDPNCNVPYHQPGAAADYPPFSKSKLKSCPEMTARIRGENPTVIPVEFEDQCPKDTSKIALAVDPEEDYHFWRQDSNGRWSGKPGSLQVTDKDASGRWIHDPSLCDRDFTDENGELNYTEFCSFFCVPRKQALFLKVGGKQYFIPGVEPSARRAKGRYSLTRRFRGPAKQGPRRNRTFRKD